MKVAIIGDSPVGLLVANYFYDLECEITNFKESEILINDIASLGKFIEGLDSFLNNSYLPLIKKLESKISFKIGKVLSVQKRFLGKNEEIVNHSRLHDLFRVVYEFAPQKADYGSELNLNKLHEDHLLERTELFGDFDIVIDVGDIFQNSLSVGAGFGICLGERFVKKKSDKYFYFDYLKDLCNVSKLLNDDKLKGTGLIIDYNGESNVIFKVLENWLFKEESNRLIILSNKSYQSFLSETYLSRVKSSEAKSIQVYKEKLNEYNASPDYIQRKLKLPIKPKPKIEHRVHYFPLSIDYLSDREGLFVSLEKSKLIEEIEGSDIETINANFIVNCQRRDRELSRYQTLKGQILEDQIIQEEAGFYLLPSFISEGKVYNEERVILLLEEIFHDLQKYFTCNP